MVAGGSQTSEMSEIRGLDVDKAVKGFALVSYVFKNDCQVNSMSGDSIRWYKETAADLEPSSPQQVANISRLSTLPTLEVSWTRTTSYPRKYATEGFISMEDIKSADIDVIARTLLRLTRAITKQVDTRIYDVVTEGMSTTTTVAGLAAATINTVTASGAWNTTTSANPIKDIMEAKRKIWTYNYNPEGASLWMSPTAHEYLLTWLINTKGSSVPNFASAKVETGVVMNFLGLNVKVSNNVTGTSGSAVVVIPKQACTWKTYQDTTSAVIESKGLGSTIRVWEIGEPILHDPRAVCIINGVETA